MHTNVKQPFDLVLFAIYEINSMFNSKLIKCDNHIDNIFFSIQS